MKHWWTIIDSKDKAQQLHGWYKKPETGLLQGSIIWWHGMGCNHEVWQPLLDIWPQYEHYSLDLPGWGLSDSLITQDYLGANLDWLQRWYQSLELSGPVYLVAHSMGGWLASHWLNNFNDQIENPPQKLILVAPAGFEDLTPLKPFVSTAARFTHLLSYLPNLSAKESRKAFYKMTPEIEKQLKNYYWHLNLTGMRRKQQLAFQQAIKSMITNPMKLRLHNYQQPVTVIRGQYDRLIPNPYLDKSLTNWQKNLTQVWPEHELITVNDSGHMVMLEQPASLVRTLKNIIPVNNN